MNAKNIDREISNYWNFTDSQQSYLSAVSDAHPEGKQARNVSVCFFGSEQQFLKSQFVHLFPPTNPW